MSFRLLLTGLSNILAARNSVAQSPLVGGGAGFLSGKSHCAGPTVGMGLRGLPAVFLLTAGRGAGFPFGVDAALGAAAAAALGGVSLLLLLIGLLSLLPGCSPTVSFLFGVYCRRLLVARTFEDRFWVFLGLGIETQ